MHVDARRGNLLEGTTLFIDHSKPRVWSRLRGLICHGLTVDGGVLSGAS